MSDEHEPRKPREQYRLRTRLIHGSFATGRWDYDHHVVPPQSSSTTFRLKSVHRGVQGFVEFGSPQAQRAPIYIYDRLDEPSRSMLEENLAAAEGGEMAVTFSTGMAAISAAICALVSSGHQIVAHRVLYGSTHSLLTNWLPRFGVRTEFCDLTNPECIAGAATRDCRVVYFETPVNPTMELIDMAAVRKVVDQLNASRPEPEQIRIVVDNTFATPIRICSGSGRLAFNWSTTLRTAAISISSIVGFTGELIDMAAVRKVVDQLNASRPEPEQIRIVAAGVQL